MEDSVHKSVLIVLVSAAMVLLALSLVQPWFTVHDSFTSDTYPAGRWHRDLKLFPDYFAFTDEGSDPLFLRWEYDDYADYFSPDNKIQSLMEFVQKGVLVSIILGWMLLISVLARSRLLTFLFAWISAAAPLFCVVTFSGGIAEAMRQSSGILSDWPTYMITGLFGERSVTRDTYLASGIDEYSWQAGWGWFTALFGGLLFAMALVVYELSALRAHEQERLTRLAEEFEEELESSQGPGMNPEPEPASLEGSPKVK